MKASFELCVNNSEFHPLQRVLEPSQSLCAQLVDVRKALAGRAPTENVEALLMAMEWQREPLQAWR